MDRHRACRQVHDLPSSGPVVGPFPVNVHCRDLRGALLDRAAEGRQGCLQGRDRHVRPDRLLQHLSLQVIGGGGGPQLDLSAIGLVTGQVRQQAGGGPEGDRQHAGDGGIQGAAVADPPEAVAAAQATDTGMGGEAGRLVDHHEAEGTIHKGHSSCRSA